MDILLKAIPIAIPVILVILIFLMGYVKAPPDVAYIISGLRKHPPTWPTSSPACGSTPRCSSVRPVSRSPFWSGWIS